MFRLSDSDPAPCRFYRVLVELPEGLPGQP